MSRLSMTFQTRKKNVMATSFKPIPRPACGTQHRQCTCGTQHRQCTCGSQHRQCTRGTQHRQCTCGTQHRQCTRGTQHRQSTNATWTQTEPEHAVSHSGGLAPSNSNQCNGEPPTSTLPKPAINNRNGREESLVCGHETWQNWHKMDATTGSSK